ncbi:methylenetetrahydrofolate reductase [NAD(P)H] [Methylococcus sp. EFPC2]|uniref:methylenetetrahydrofolate reductase [NAD(P)H] n=1 Tax=Methylococcus sp. EFPC2 TaxID=2812648 RepID=UPI001966FE80|nr:methylenetetrahydrofolate reductase [NAD(P)H] [Methylococcus sp. EFPC2]QSA96300.1 methylenetetrahydrofolate reductase [NAD(P)H] [Methylococcus sp. EFPC2]
MDTQKHYPPVFSFEFFPPKSDEAAAKLRETTSQLAVLKPRFCSVTFGAGGSTRERTFETVVEIQETTGIEGAPHISCIASTKANIREVLQAYQSRGIRHIVALRGDMPSGMLSAGEFRYANELVEFIRAETGDHFHIEVAAYPETHPQAPNYAADLRNFKRKVEAGANAAITQYFYNAEAYFRFVDDCEKLGLALPIVPGIMPITNYSQLARFSEACGADIPRWMRKRLEQYGDDRKAIRAFGLEVVSDLCRRLLEGGAPGLHFYTLNQAEATLGIWRNLGLGMPA